MGLELTELILETGERYAVEFEDNDWANLRTFGDWIDMVKQKIGRTLDPPIEESGYEIILQSLLAELRLRLPKSVEINEGTQLRKLKRYAKRYEVCSFVRQRFPELPSWVCQEFEGSGIGCAMWFWFVVRPPRRTVGDVAKVITERRQKLLKVRDCSVADIENELRDYMCKAFALKPEEIQKESDLVTDLGLG